MHDRRNGDAADRAKARLAQLRRLARINPSEDRALEDRGSFAKADAVPAAIDCVLLVIPFKVSHGASFVYTFVFQPFQGVARPVDSLTFF